MATDPLNEAYMKLRAHTDELAIANVHLLAALTLIRSTLRGRKTTADELLKVVNGAIDIANKAVVDYRNLG
jgi:hypothetical protein